MNFVLIPPAFMIGNKTLASVRLPFALKGGHYRPVRAKRGLRRGPRRHFVRWQ